MEQRLTSKWTAAVPSRPQGLIPNAYVSARVTDRGPAAGIVLAQFAIIAIALLLVRPAFVTQDTDDLRTASVNIGLVILLSAASVGATLWLHHVRGSI